MVGMGGQWGAVDWEGAMGSWAEVMGAQGQRGPRDGGDNKELGAMGSVGTVGTYGMGRNKGNNGGSREWWGVTDTEP